MLHLFGMILTHYAPASNNHGMAEGNYIPMQKLLWRGEPHTIVTSEAIRWALRYHWQRSGHSVNRRWNDDLNNFRFENPDFDAMSFIDDDVLGYMKAEGAKQENDSESSAKKATVARKSRSTEIKQKDDSRFIVKGSAVVRRGRLAMARAVSTTPFADDLMFNSVSGDKSRTSLYETEYHATYYQYGFAITPDDLVDRARINMILDGLLSLSGVAGNNSRALYDFSPKCCVFRWTHDFAPRMLYCFREDELGRISIPDVLEQIESDDLDPREIWVGGPIAKSLTDSNVHAFAGVKNTIENLKQTIARDLNL